MSDRDSPAAQRRVPARRVVAVLAAVGALMTSACGSDAVTKQDVIARGDAICTRALSEIRALPASGASGSVSGLAAYLRRLVRVVDREASQLDALPRPAQPSLLDAYIAASRRDAAQYGAMLAAARSGDQAGVNRALSALRASPAAGLAARYGLTQCAQPGGTGVS